MIQLTERKRTQQYTQKIKQCLQRLIKHGDYIHNFLISNSFIRSCTDIFLKIKQPDSNCGIKPGSKWALTNASCRRWERFGKDLGNPLGTNNNWRYHTWHSTNSYRQGRTGSSKVSVQIRSLEKVQKYWVVKIRIGITWKNYLGERFIKTLTLTLTLTF